MYENLLALEAVDLVIFLVNQPNCSTSNSAGQDGSIAEMGNNTFLKWAFRKLESRHSSSHTYDDPLELRDIADSALTTSSISARLQRTDEGYTFTADTITEIQNNGLHLLIQVSSTNLAPTTYQIFDYGIWSFNFGKDAKSKRPIPGYQEWLTNAEGVHDSLETSIGTSKTNLILYESRSHRISQSLVINHRQRLWKFSKIPGRVIMTLVSQRNPEKWLHSLPSRTSTSASPDMTSQNASTMTDLLFLGKWVGTKIKNTVLNRFYEQQWILLYSRSVAFNQPLDSYKMILPPKDRIWADPHVIQNKGSYYIFFEEMLRSNSKGHLSVMKFNPLDGTHSKPTPILVKDFHLSYPFVFRHHDTYYMIPETHQNQTIDLYECTDFPHQWEFKKTLIHDIRAVDTTVYFDGDLWWLFTSIAEHRGSSTYDESFLFYSDALDSSNWQPHPKNPIVSDSRVARSAGKIFTHQGQLIRPTQNCSRQYGESINFQKILKLDVHDYQEEPLATIDAGTKFRLSGIHSFSSNADLTVIDAKLWRNKLPF